MGIERVQGLEVIQESHIRWALKLRMHLRIPSEGADKEREDSSDSGNKSNGIRAKTKILEIGYTRRRIFKAGTEERREVRNGNRKDDIF